MLEGTSAVVAGVVVLAPLFLFTAPFLTSLGLVVVDVFLGLKNEPNHVTRPICYCDNGLSVREKNLNHYRLQGPH